MNVMKTSLTIFPCVLGSAFLYIRVCPGLPFATKRIGPPCCTLFTFVTCCLLQIILSQNYLLPTISVLAENTLLKTAYHFLLLLVGFDTLTYRKDYDRSPMLVGHQVRPLPRALLVDPLTCTPSLPYCFLSKNNFSEGFIPFGLHLIFFFCETLKQGKKLELALGSGSIG